MTISLLRNCLHGSATALYLKEGPIKVLFKSSVTENGVSDLLREHEGLEWYGNQRIGKPKLASKLHTISRRYARLEIQFVDACSVKPKTGVKRNTNLLERIITHYAFIWKQANSVDGKFPIHGDLSLENILFNESCIYFIDWEHFSTGVAPWGYDVIYLLFETFWFRRQCLFFSERAELKSISYLIQFLNSLGPLENRFITHPLASVVDFIRENRHLWGSQLEEFPMKLPLLSMKVPDIDRIDEFIANDIKRNFNEKIVSNRLA